MQPSATYRGQTDPHEYKQGVSNQAEQQGGALGEHSLQLIQGEKDLYELKVDITRQMAAEILTQTGLEIVFEKGKSLRKDFSLGRGQFGVFRVGYGTKAAHYVGIKVTQGDQAAEAEVKIQAAFSKYPHIMPSIDYCKVVGTLYQVMPLAGLGCVL